jgi:predicted 3-demethylubiquinone-9 3-methyltransferase (glyoxalase superfamily)
VRKIVPHLWYDKEAGEAAELYVAVFEGSRILNRTVLEGTPSGDAETLAIELAGTEIRMISAGPYFRFTPAVSFLVSCADAAELDRLHSALRPGGKDLMELGEYPFSPRYAWIEDRFGLSWQLVAPGDGAAPPPGRAIVPTLMFTGADAGKAEEAIRFWTSLVPGSSVGTIVRWEANAPFDKAGDVMHADFELAGEPFAAMDSGYGHGFGFNEAVSFMLFCDGQAEIDRYWAALSAVPEAEQCGWLKDRYGLSWQVVPTAMDAMMADPDPARRARVVEAFLPMKKFDLAALERAYRGS